MTILDIDLAALVAKSNVQVQKPDIAVNLGLMRDAIEDIQTCINAMTNMTTEQVQDVVGAMVSGNTETNINVTYDDADGKLDFVVTAAGLTTEQVQDIVGDMVSSNTETNITVTYDDPNGKINFSVALATTTTAGAMSATDKVKLDRLDPAADDIRETFNVENEQTVGSGGAIAVGDLLVVAGVTVQTNNGVEYIGVIRDNGAALSDFYLPEGIAIKAVPLNGRAEEAMMTKGVVTITQTGLGNRAVGDKLYVEKTGTGSSEKWQFTISDHPGSHHVGRVMNYAGTGNDYVVFLDFTLVKALEHVDKDKKILQDPVFSIVNALPASPSEGDRHIVTASGSDQYKIAQRVGSSWIYSDTPTEGWMVYVQDEDRYYKFVTEWVTLQSGEDVYIHWTFGDNASDYYVIDTAFFSIGPSIAYDNSKIELTDAIANVYSSAFTVTSISLFIQLSGGSFVSSNTISSPSISLTNMVDLTNFSGLPASSTQYVVLRALTARAGTGEGRLSSIILKGRMR